MGIKEGVLYLSLHNQLIKKFGVNRTINKRLVFAKLGRHFLVPKNLRGLVIKEMEEKKLFFVENENILLLPSKINIEEDTNFLYKVGGFF